MRNPLELWSSTASRSSEGPRSEAAYSVQSAVRLEFTQNVYVCVCVVCRVYGRTKLKTECVEFATIYC